MDYSLLSAGRTAHLKIVAVALAFSIVVVIVGINARTTDIATAQVQANGVVVKAGQPTKSAGQEASTIR